MWAAPHAFRSRGLDRLYQYCIKSNRLTLALAQSSHCDLHDVGVEPIFFVRLPFQCFQNHDMHETALRGWKCMDTHWEKCRIFCCCRMAESLKLHINLCPSHPPSVHPCIHPFIYLTHILYVLWAVRMPKKTDKSFLDFYRWILPIFTPRHNSRLPAFINVRVAIRTLYTYINNY